MPVTLSPETIAELKSYQDHIRELWSEVEKAEKAGIDVTDLKNRLAAAEKVRSGLLTTYGSNAARRRLGV